MGTDGLMMFTSLHKGVGWVPGEEPTVCLPSSRGLQLFFDRHGEMMLSSINELCSIHTQPAVCVCGMQVTCGVDMADRH